VSSKIPDCPLPALTQINRHGSCTSAWFATINSLCVLRATDPLSRRRFAVVWPQFLIVTMIGGLFFGFALLRFRRVAAVTI
jgi:hypothetical protein